MQKEFDVLILGDEPTGLWLYNQIPNKEKVAWVSFSNVQKKHLVPLEVAKHFGVARVDAQYEIFPDKTHSLDSETVLSALNMVWGRYEVKTPFGGTFSKSKDISWLSFEDLSETLVLSSFEVISLSLKSRMFELICGEHVLLSKKLVLNLSSQLLERLIKANEKFFEKTNYELPVTPYGIYPLEVQMDSNFPLEYMPDISIFLKQPWPTHQMFFVQWNKVESTFTLNFMGPYPISFEKYSELAKNIYSDFCSHFPAIEQSIKYFKTPLSLECISDRSLLEKELYLNCKLKSSLSLPTLKTRVKNLYISSEFVDNYLPYPLGPLLKMKEVASEILKMKN